MAGLGKTRRKKKCIRYMREDGASTDGEDYDDGSSRLGSQRSTCDTDSTHDMDVDSPRPIDTVAAAAASSRLSTSSYGQQHSPLSPLCPNEEDDVDVAGLSTTTKLDLGFPTSATGPSLPLLPSSSASLPLLLPPSSSSSSSTAPGLLLPMPPLASSSASPSSLHLLPAEKGMTSTPIKAEYSLAAMAMPSPSLAAT